MSGKKRRPSAVVARNIYGRLVVVVLEHVFQGQWNEGITTFSIQSAGQQSAMFDGSEGDLVYRALIAYHGLTQTDGDA